MRECGGVVATAGAIPQEEEEGGGKKRGCRRGSARKERSSEALQNNINRDEMKQHPHFCFFAYSLCLPPGIDHITPDILVSPFNCLTGDGAHTCKHRRDGTGCLFSPFHFAPCFEIAARSGKCHVLDLFAPLHTGAWRGWSRVQMWGGGFAELRVCSRDGAVRLR